MRKLLSLLLASTIAVLAIGCAGQDGTSGDRAGQIADMEKRVNEKALKDNPPPPGEGPGN